MFKNFKIKSISFLLILFFLSCVHEKSQQKNAFFIRVFAINSKADIKNNSALSINKTDSSSFNKILDKRIMNYSYDYLGSTILQSDNSSAFFQRPIHWIDSRIKVYIKGKWQNEKKERMNILFECQQNNSDIIVIESPKVTQKTSQKILTDRSYSQFYISKGEIKRYKFGDNTRNIISEWKSDSIRVVISPRKKSNITIIN